MDKNVVVGNKVGQAGFKIKLIHIIQKHLVITLKINIINFQGE